MRDEVTEHIRAGADELWALVADVRNTGRLSPETFEAEWLDGATGPAVGVRFRGHVRRGGVDRGGPVYWTLCRITECEPGRAFAFDVLAGGKALNSWRYGFVPRGDGTDVTESFALHPSALMRVYWALARRWRAPYNRENMRATLRRLKEIAEAPEVG